MYIVADGLNKDGKIRSIVAKDSEELLKWMDSNGIGWITKYLGQDDMNLIWITRNIIERWIESGVLD